MPINEQTLESFLGGNMSVLDEIIGTEASQLTNILNSATISGMQTSEILNQVTTASSAKTSRSLINTRLNTYSRVATNTMMKDAPDDTKYVYVGPVDERTRDECLEYSSAGALTEAQIIENGWTASLVDGGGYNCRHKWEIASEEGIKLFEGKKAQQVIKDKKTPVYKPKPKPYNKDALYQAGKHKTVADSKSFLNTNIADNVTLTTLKDLDVANEVTDVMNNLFNTYKLKKLDQMDARVRGRADAQANGRILQFKSKTFDREYAKNVYKKDVIDYKANNIEIREYVDKVKKLVKAGELSPRYLKEAKKFEDRLENIEKFKHKRWRFFEKGRELENVITHEFAHIIQDQYAGMLNPKYRRSTASPSIVRKAQEDLDFVYRRLTTPAGKKIYKNKYNKSGGYELSTGEIGMISEYAGTNANELFAESFSMYATGHADELPKIMKEYLDSFFKNFEGEM